VFNVRYICFLLLSSGLCCKGREHLNYCEHIQLLCRNYISVRWTFYEQTDRLICSIFCGPHSAQHSHTPNPTVSIVPLSVRTLQFNGVIKNPSPGWSQLRTMSSTISILCYLVRCCSSDERLCTMLS
jgi:hypothetical protein